MGASWTNGIDPSLPAEGMKAGRRPIRRPAIQVRDGRVHRTARGRPGRSWRPPRPPPRSRRSCPSTAPGPAPATVRGPAPTSSRRPRNVGRAVGRLARSAARPSSDRRPRRCGQRKDLAEGRLELVGREAGLGRIEVDVDLERGPGRRRPGSATSGTSRSSRRARSTESTVWIDVEDVERPAHLVRLERADQLPASRRAPRAPWRRPPGPGSRRGRSRPAATASRRALGRRRSSRPPRG